jgi:hypothetical protein
MIIYIIIVIVILFILLFINKPNDKTNIIDVINVKKLEENTNIN